MCYNGHLLKVVSFLLIFGLFYSLPSILTSIYLNILTFLTVFITYKLITIKLPKKNDPIIKKLKLKPNARYEQYNNNVGLKLPSIDNNLSVKTELGLTIDLIISSFVMSWFERINDSSNSEFPTIVKSILTGAVDNIQLSLSKCDIASIVLFKIVPILTKYISVFNESKRIILKGSSVRGVKYGNIDLNLAVEFNKRHRLHHSLSLRTKKHLIDVDTHIKNKIIVLLPLLIPKDELSSPYINILLREILSSCVLVPLILKFSNPDTWNLKIIELSTKILEEREKIDQVKKLLSDKIDLETSHRKISPDKLNLFSMDAHFQENSSSEHFEHYLKGISNLNDVTHLRFVFFAILIKISQLNKEKITSKKQEKYRDRLQLSLNLIETKLKLLRQQSNNDELKHIPDLSLSSTDKVVAIFDSFLSSITFEDIRHYQDFMSSFKNFLRESNYEKGMVYFKFWEIVEEIKNPLEDINNREFSVSFTNSELNRLKNISSVLTANELDILKNLDDGLVENISIFHEDNGKVEETTIMLIRKSLLLLQDEARKSLENDYLTSFKNTEKFLLLLSETNRSTVSLFSKFFKTQDSTSTFLLSSNPYSLLNTLLTMHTSVKSTSSTSNTFESSLLSTLLSTDMNNVDEIESNILNLDNVKARATKKEEVSKPKTTNKRHSSVISIGFNLKNETHLNVKEEIANITMLIDRLEKELQLLSHLILKANLTDNQSELKLLEKSQRSIKKDLEKYELLHQRYTIQDNTNRLFQKSDVFVRSHFIDYQTENGPEIVYYLINIKFDYRINQKSWKIARRFSEFVKLYSYLNDKHGNLFKKLNCKLDFPQRINISFRFHVSKTLLFEDRQNKLEAFLRKLIVIPEICDDEIFRKFLTDSRSFTIDKKSQSKVTSKALNINSGVIKRSSSDMLLDIVDDDFEDTDIVNDHYYHSHSGHEEGFNSHEEEVSYVKPICNLFLSIFSANNDDTTWIRGKAIVAVLRQLLGNTIDKFVKSTVMKYQSEEALSRIIVDLRDSIWGADGLLDKKNNEIKMERSVIELNKSQADAQLLLQSLFIELTGKVVGLRSSREAALKIHGMVQNPYINTSLILEILDVIIDEVFLKSDS
ncbi:hypothetical protein Kpol_1069p6 [Vanderwaltozyma polyspora DSM 70294]|uniref:PXA domain-containing protein n=1 Tax=Vanderwaltozyma polyspora (strain ATCC 22028 / DSM 70294 / BCRC 21397 / CBS 2163 / NBRC 10782 / NRRL Y-8283 / UCD 57-17) TaxID=436907 RepID=A7TRB6_VANPO|nr:uncharacterized protein Kpol_1069p6 [Vanderwaltozyma polyspora DSM 70294]EDO15184.1 hypothetical protein Kpol_1069p6 [Vanderwaltozyma polyspora DSM 70294]